MPTYVLLKNFPEYAAANIADAQNLYTALLDPSTETNALTIGRITGRLPPLCIADTAVPLVIDSIDDAAGTRSSWVTNANASLAFAIGDADAALSHRYASANVSTISANTRIGNLVLATSNLFAAMSGSFGHPQRGMGTQFTAHIQQTDALGFTQTYGLLPVTIEPGVFGTYPTGDPDQGALANYVTLASTYANNSASSAANANTYAFASLGYSNDSQNYANLSRANANLSRDYSNNSSNFANSASGFANNAQNFSNTAQNYATPNGTTTLTPGANVNWNMAANVTASLIANQNCNLIITAFSDGGTGALAIAQNATGNWTVSWSATNGNIAWPGNVAPTQTTTANCVDEYSFIVRGTTIRGGYIQNYAK